MNIPKHLSLTITHNDHKTVYESVKDFLHSTHKPYHWIGFKDEAAYDKACATDELWEMTWFPDTPVGSRTVYAPTLEELLEESSKSCPKAPSTPKIA